jgi:tetratricopeptide (TPR) repeat protein
LAATDFGSFWKLGIACLTLTFAGCASLPVAGWRDQSTGPNERERRLATRGLKYPLHTHLAHARWQEEIGSLNEARASYEFILQENPKSVEAMLGMARVDQLAGRADEAERRFQKVLRLKPNSSDVLGAAAQFYAAEQRWPEALELQTAAVKAAPQATEHRFQLGLMTARSGNIEAAMPHFVETVGEAEANYNIGRILYDEGDWERAEQHFVLAVLKKPELQHASSMLEKLRGEQRADATVGGQRPSHPSASRLAQGQAGAPVPSRPVIKNAKVEVSTTHASEFTQPIRSGEIVPVGHTVSQ